jgi:gamma-glutamyl hercynylcysteine S-oxide synthase
MPLQEHVELDRGALIGWYLKNRARSRALFDMLSPETYYERPIALRHPIVFYEGHIPAFTLNTLVKRGLGRPGIDDALERLFARGIDPDEDTAHGAEAGRWPTREEVHAFVREADARTLDALANGDLVQPGHPLLEGGDAAFTVLEHEAMHQETLLYMWHELPYERKVRPDDYHPIVEAAAPERSEDVFVPEGPTVLGATRGAIRFGWDNEFPAQSQIVPAFRIERVNVTNADYLAFVDAGGYQNPTLWSPRDWEWLQESTITHPHFWARTEQGWMWRGMFELIPLPLQWPVYVTHAEASAYARWRSRRLPTEAEYQRAAYGDPSDGRVYPWGGASPDASHGTFDFSSWDPTPVGTHPAGRSIWGVDDLIGNGWEWTSDIFKPFPGFVASASYPEYSADFFDEQHYVMKGASSATALELIRPSFRNWFRPRYPYMYAKFRCVESQQ